MGKQGMNRKFSSDIVTGVLAYVITGFVLAITIYIAIYSLYCGKDDQIFLTLIPLWGTWMGIVLAFYFSKSNFDAATQAIKELSPNEKMAKLPVREYMIYLDKLEYLTYDKIKDKTIYEILNKKEFEPYNRFAILNNEDVAMYIIHRSLFNYYIALKVSKGINTADIQALTFKVFEEDKDNDDTIKDILKNKNSFAVVSINDTLLDAKFAMESKPHSLDVFVTETGDANRKVMGLITNNMILEKAKV
jgi:hypothetical protein